MAENLVQSKVLIGKSADDVQKMLGKADIDHGKALVYNIDLGLPFRTKHDGLLIYLDGKRSVTEAKTMD